MALMFEWQNYPPERLLAERFRIATGFHPEQRHIIEQLAQGKRILAIQRTGWGKSLCYQMASLYYPHLTVVFSPLKALMRDQCQRCNDVYAIPSAVVSSDFSEDENQITLEQAVAGKLKLLFIAPERLSNILWQRYVPSIPISMIVIDEAHCISIWGHDFRPGYRRIINLLSAIPQNTPVLALTATANKRVEKDILQQMGEDVLVVRGIMHRFNLHLQVIHLKGDEEKLGYLGEIVPRLPGPGIIYTATKRDAEMVADFLKQGGVVAEYYHAGRDGDVRPDIEQKFMADQFHVVCATNALGMGIDKSNIRFVIHYHIPGSPVYYYQEMGRAGRDGMISSCTMLYDSDDLIIQEHFILSGKPDGKQYERVLSLLKTKPDGLGEWGIMRQTGFSQSSIRTILADLEDLRYVERDAKKRYSAIYNPDPLSFTNYDHVREQKEQELNSMRDYAYHQGCYMEYLTTFLGDQPGYRCGVCGYCRPTNFPSVKISERMRERVVYFLDKHLVPHIEKRSNENLPAHENGWALSYYGMTSIGKFVRICKYENAGSFPTELVERAVEVIRSSYPIGTINAIVSVPPTKSGKLVENFARQVAASLSIIYIPAIAKIRDTREQKDCTNWLQKKDNVKGAFVITLPSAVTGRTVLLIDDIYDSGQILREIGRVLMRAGANIVYPFAIVKTKHSDDQ